MTAFIALGARALPVSPSSSSSFAAASPLAHRSAHPPSARRHHHRHHVTRRPARFFPASHPCSPSTTFCSDRPSPSSDDAPKPTTATTMTSSTSSPSSDSSSSPSSETSPSPTSTSDPTAATSASSDATPSALSGPVRVPADQISDAEKKAFRAKYEHLRGADVETVSDAMRRFTENFQRPVPIVYRGVINETISTTHLARVCPMWRYDALCALGFDAVFSTFLKFYPSADEREKLYNAVAASLRFDPADLRADAEAAIAAVEGMTEDELFKALDATPSAQSATNGVLEAMAYTRDAVYGEWYYSRLFGIGLITVMDLTNTTLDATTAEKWAVKLGVESSKFGTEMGTYVSGLERLKQAEQIFAEATAREAKKTAERLAAKAKKAAEEAAQLEGSAEGEGDAAGEQTTASGDASTEQKSDAAEPPKA